MATRLNISNIIFLALVAMTMLHRSSAQTTHVVGDALGWTFPPGGEAAYRTWASTQNFSVGDVLLFNFTTGQHDVAEVTKDSFDSCNGNNPISRSTVGPASITLTAGEHHYICTITGHCDAGMKVSISVASSTPVSPAPSPPETTPPPVATPAPAPAPSRQAPSPTSGAPPPPRSVRPVSPSTPTSTPPPSGTTQAPPPPDNSASSLAVATLPLTFLAVAFAVLYN